MNFLNPFSLFYSNPSDSDDLDKNIIKPIEKS
jgi:hypothetical protein